MKKMFVLMLLLYQYAGYSQQYLMIDSLIVYDIIESEPDSIIDEQFGEGPFVFGYFTLYNHTNEPLVIRQSNYSMLFCYDFAEEKHSSLFMHLNMEQDQVTINAMDSFKFKCGARLMIDVELQESQRFISQNKKIVNHSEIFKDILPTLYAELTLQNGVHIISTTQVWKFNCDNVEMGKPLKIYPDNRHSYEDTPIRYRE